MKGQFIYTVVFRHEEWLVGATENLGQLTQSAAVHINAFRKSDAYAICITTNTMNMKFITMPINYTN